MSKSKYYRSIQSLQGYSYKATRTALESTYYALYLSKFIIKGMDYRQQQYVLRKRWANGTVGAFNLITGDITFAPYCAQEYDIYDNIDKITFINEHGSPLIPSHMFTVDKDAVIGYASKSRKPVKEIAGWYLDRIAQVEMVINTNIQQQKRPFLVVSDSANSAKMNDLITRILNNEMVIDIKSDEPQRITGLKTGIPYVVDKLVEYKKGLENDLKTYLGIDNQGGYLNREQQNLDTTCSNDVEINLNCDNLYNELKDFFDRCNETLGSNLSIKLNHQHAAAISETKEGDFGPKGPHGGENNGIDKENL